MPPTSRWGKWIYPTRNGYPSTDLSSASVQWLPSNTTEGHRGFVIPSTVNNWYQDPAQATTHGDWWIYLDDFAMARGVHSGGQGVDDLPRYP